MGATAAIASVRVGQTRRGPFSGAGARRAVPDRNGTTFALFRPGFFAMVYPCSIVCARAWVTGSLRQVVITVAAAPPTSSAKRLTPTRMANRSRALRCSPCPLTRFGWRCGAGNRRAANCCIIPNRACNMPAGCFGACYRRMA